MRSALLLLPVLAVSSAFAAEPFTPAAAQNPHPRLCLEPAQAALVRGRLSREPYATLYARVLSRARAAVPTGSDYSADRTRSTIAKAAAFVYALGAEVTAEAERNTLGQKAEALLATLILETGISGISDFETDLVTAERLHPWAMAHDLLRGAGYPFTREAEIRERLAGLAGNVFDDFTHRYRDTFRSFNENHTSKVASAVGLAAITLDGYEPATDDPRAEWKRPARWIAWALDRLDLLIADALTTDTEGGYTEGPVYYWYSGLQHLPFLRAWHLYSGAYGGSPRQVEANRWVGDLWTAASVRRQQSWLLALRMPNGTLPPVNDATPGIHYFFGLLSDHPEAAALHWAWKSAGGLADGGLSEEILCAHDDTIAPALPPGPPSRFLPEAGAAVLRTGWGEEDVYLLLQAEHGKNYGRTVRRDGRPLEGTAGHNHADPLSFIVHAFGEYLALDGGYLGWTHHDKVKGPVHHNLILVDGVGPKEPYLTIPPVGIVDGGLTWLDPDRDGGWVAGGDGEAYLEGGADFGSLRFARARTRYSELTSEPVDLGRHVALLDGRAVALLDDASGTQEHVYTWLLHGNAGGTSGGSFEPRAGQGGIWRRPRAAMAAAFATPGAASEITQAVDVHDAGGWAERQHVVLRFSARGSTVRAATLLALTRASEGDAIFTMLAGGAGALARFADGSWALAGRGPQIAWEGGSAQGDALALSAPATGLPSALYALQMTRVTLGSTAVLEAVTPATVMAGSDGTAVRAEVDAPSGVTLRFPGCASSVRGACRLETSAAETRIEVPAGRRLVEVSLGAARQNSAPVSLPFAPGSAAAGVPVGLDGSGSCDADGQPLTYRWELVEAPAGAVLTGEQTALATLTGNASGSHRVALVVSDGGLTDRAEVTIEMSPRPAAPRASRGCIAAAASVSGAGLVLVVAILVLGFWRRRRV